jgi:hypothetical protein
VRTFEVQHPDGTRVNVGHTHRQFEELLSWVDAGCWPFVIGPAGSFKTSAAAKVAEALCRPFHMDSMSEGKTPFDLLGFNDATGKPVHTELRRAWEKGGVFLCDEMDAGNANVLATLNALLSQPVGGGARRGLLPTLVARRCTPPRRREPRLRQIGPTGLSGPTARLWNAVVVKKSPSPHSTDKSCA